MREGVCTQQRKERKEKEYTILLFESFIVYYVSPLSFFCLKATFNQRTRQTKQTIKDEEEQSPFAHGQATKTSPGSTHVHIKFPLQHVAISKNTLDTTPVVVSPASLCVLLVILRDTSVEQVEHCLAVLLFESDRYSRVVTCKCQAASSEHQENNNETTTNESSKIERKPKIQQKNE